MNRKWYYEGVVYQIYPRSFFDHDGDGIGDIKGIIEKIDHLVDLGIDIVWLSPVYQSPNDDNGYDISDYLDIMKEFGTIDDMKELIHKLHDKGIKLIMDLVVNHTSDEHEWFQKSVKRIPPYDNYYYWTDKPRKWGSFFGGEAFTYHPDRKQYYLHLFSKKQPDLNWNNPQVIEEVKNIMRFWLDLGVDGFREDVINLIGKENGLPEGKFRIVLRGLENYLCHPDSHNYLQELRKDVLDHYDCFTVGETAFVTPDQALEYIGFERNELDMLFQFEHMGIDNTLKWFMKKFKPWKLKEVMFRWQEKLHGKGWNTIYFENHDQPRSVSRFGSSDYHYESATMLATWLLTQQGTPFIYQGQEIGMQNAGFDKLQDYRDIETLNIFPLGRKLGLSKHYLMKTIMKMSRDNARTPFQWDDSTSRGFSTSTPWIPVGRHPENNLAFEQENSSGVYAFYKKLLVLRKTEKTLCYGDTKFLFRKHHQWVSYVRYDEQGEFLILMNYSRKTLVVPQSVDLSQYKLILSNYSAVDQSKEFQPYQANIYKKNER